MRLVIQLSASRRGDVVQVLCRHIAPYSFLLPTLDISGGADANIGEIPIPLIRRLVPDTVSDLGRVIPFERAASTGFASVRFAPSRDRADGRELQPHLAARSLSFDNEDRLSVMVRLPRVQRRSSTRECQKRNFVQAQADAAVAGNDALAGVTNLSRYPFDLCSYRAFGFSPLTLDRSCAFP